MRKKQFPYLSFRKFFGFWAKNFSDFRPKNFKKMWKLPFECPEEQIMALYLFKKFWTVLDFLQKPLAWFSKFYLHVQSKNFGRNSFRIFLFRIFFRILSEEFFRLLAKKLQGNVKTTSACPQEQLVALYLFKKFWIVLDFLQKPSAWFSSFYIRVQSKICGRKVFFIPPFWNFPDFERKIFQTFGQKTSRKCENYLLSVQRNNLWLYIFLKSFEPFWIFYRNLWHGSQNSIYMSRVKISEETVFVFFSSEFFFGFWAKNFSDFWPKNFKEMWKLPSACPQ